MRLGARGGGKTARRFARFRIKLIGKHCTTGRDGTRNCDEGAEGGGQDDGRAERKTDRREGEVRGW